MTAKKSAQAKTPTTPETPAPASVAPALTVVPSLFTVADATVIEAALAAKPSGTRTTFRSQLRDAITPLVPKGGVLVNPAIKVQGGELISFKSLRRAVTSTNRAFKKAGNPARYIAREHDGHLYVIRES